MAYTSWYFCLDRERGRWRRLAAAWMWRFLHGEDRVPEVGAMDILFVAELVVEMEERVPMRLWSMRFSKDPIRPDGFLDRAAFEANLRLMLESVPFPVPRTPGDTVVASASARFAQRQKGHQVEWQPTAAELTTLQAELSRQRLLVPLATLQAMGTS